MNTSQYTPKPQLASKLNVVAYVLSAVVILLVGVMRRVKLDVGVDFSFLPAFNAGFNIIVSISLLLALIFIKQKKIEAHRKAIYTAMIFSALFLLTYVLYHFTTTETTFCKEGTIRTVYFVLLISHIVLAGVSLPFILLTFIKGYTHLFESHKKMARIVWPVWFYVAVTGPIVYFMLKPCYAG